MIKKHSIYTFFMLFFLTLCSCATIFNTPKTTFKVVTNEASSLIIGKDTLKNMATNRLCTVERSKKPLTLTAFNDTATKTVTIKSKFSDVYWLNLGPYSDGIGFLIDAKTPKKYTYPPFIYLNLATKDSAYLTYQPLEKQYDKSNILKITPFKLIGLINPAIEMSYERKHDSRFSTQVTASYFFPDRLIDRGDNFKPEIKGFRGAIEERFYLKKSALLGRYLGLELDYLRNQYNEIATFVPPYDPKDSTTYEHIGYNDSFRLKRETYSLNLRLGRQIILKRLAIDISAGLGLRYRNVQHFDRINPKDVLKSPIDFSFYQVIIQEGKYWTVSVPLNFRIGWTF